MIKVMILGSLLMLSYEDFRYKTVPIWQLVILGILCGINLAYAGILMHEMPKDSLWGVLFGVAILLISVITGWLGAGDGVVLLLLGLGLGGVKMIKIFLTALLLMAVSAGILMVRRGIHLKYEMPLIPFIFLAAVEVMLCG